MGAKEVTEKTRQWEGESMRSTLSPFLLAKE